MRMLLTRIWERTTGHGEKGELVKQYIVAGGLTKGQVKRLHLERLAALLSHASKHVPYYQEQLNEAGIEQDLIARDPFGTLNRLPVLEKNTIRERFDHLRSRDESVREWHYNTTGGSTGEPVRFIQDLQYAVHNLANKTLFDLWSGYSPGQPKIVLWGSERDLHVGSETFKTRLGRFVRNDHWLNTFRLSEPDMRSHVNRINAIRPVQILAYVESAFELATFIERERLDVHRPTSVMTSAGTLQPHMRAVIERVFRCPVFNRYGSREVGDIACECERHQGLHINPITHYVEIIRADGSACLPGEVGEVIVTLLTNLAMPFIRFRIGDLAAWAERECDCGCHWPTLESVSGRVNSVIRTSGRSVDSAALTSLLYFKNAEKTALFSSFSRYQLIQVGRDYLRFKALVKEEDQDLWETEKRIVTEKLCRTFGEQVRIDVEQVGHISPSPSGKHHYIWSEVRG